MNRRKGKKTAKDKSKFISNAGLMTDEDKAEQMASKKVKPGGSLGGSLADRRGN